jgi:hypothetical protein
MVAMLKGMGGKMGEAGGGRQFSLLDKEKLAKEAEAMGPGVTLIDAEPLATETGEGYRARFAFADINQLRLNQNPGERAPNEGGAAGGPPAGDKEEPLAFVFQGGDQPLLTIRPPRGEEPAGAASAAEPEAEAEDPADAQAAMMMMAQMFDGLRVAIYIEVEGEIVETNASYRDGSRVTLMEMDFSKLLADPARLRAFVEQEPDSLEEAKALMKDVPGVKVDPNQEIRIRFAG